MRNLRQTLVGLATASAIVASVAAPTVASAQSWESRHRQEKKNEWRNLGYAGAALAGLGLLSKNGTLATVGVVGGLYSAYRYEEDRKSQSKMDRQRAAFYSRSSYWHKGHKYERRTVWNKGHKYYKFVCVR